MNAKKSFQKLLAGACALMLTQGVIAARAETGAPPQPAAEEAGQATADWSTLEVRYSGRRPSIALHPVLGDPYLSFYESNLQNLFLARYTGAFGDSCGGDRGWHCSNANGTATAGTDTHLAFLDTGAQEFGVAWTVPGQRAFHISRFTDSLTWAGTDWSVTEPGAPGYARPTDLMYIGGTPIIALEELRYDGARKYFRASRHMADQSANAYEVESLDGSSSHGRFASLDWGPGDDGALSANKTERTAYRANTGGLRYASARYDGTGVNCARDGMPSPTNWSCSWVDPNANVYATSILAPKCTFQGCTERTRIFYYDHASGKLKIATATGNANDSCNGAQNWTCGAIDAIGAGKTVDGIRVSAAQTGVGQTAGLMKVAYTDKDDAVNSVLKIATYTGNANDSCTPGGLTGWSCETVDDGGADDHDTGLEPVLAWNGTRLYIAYVDQTASYLMVATPRDTAVGISHSKTYPNKILRGQEFELKYTVNNGKGFALTGMSLSDPLLPYHEYVGVAHNSCGFTVEYAAGNLTDLLKLADGEVAPNGACTLVLRMRFGPGTPLGARSDTSNALHADQTYDVAPAGGNTSFQVLAATYLPVVLRDVDANW